MIFGGILLLFALLSCLIFKWSNRACLQPKALQTLLIGKLCNNYVLKMFPFRTVQSTSPSTAHSGCWRQVLPSGFSAEWCHLARHHLKGCLKNLAANMHAMRRWWLHMGGSYYTSSSSRLAWCTKPTSHAVTKRQAINFWYFKNLFIEFHYFSSFMEKYYTVNSKITCSHENWKASLVLKY